MLEAKALEEHIKAPIEEQPPKKQKRKNNKTSEIATSSKNSRNDEGEATHSRNDEVGSGNDAVEGHNDDSTPSLRGESRSNPKERLPRGEASRNDEGEATHSRNDEGGSGNDAVEGHNDDSTPSLRGESRSNPNDEIATNAMHSRNDKGNEIATNAMHSRNDEGEAQHSRNDEDSRPNKERNVCKTIFFDCTHLVYVGEKEYLLSNAKGQRVKLQKGDEIILPKGDTERYLLYKGLFKKVWSE